MAKFTLFNYTKPGKGVRKGAPRKKGVALYFSVLVKSFWKFITLNLLYIVASLPAILIAWVLSSFFVTWSATLAQVNIDKSAPQLLIISILVSVVLMLVSGSGPATAAMSYIMHKYANDTHAWAVSEFYEQMKINFKQGMAAYFINITLTACLLVAYNFYSYTFSGLTAVFFRVMVILSVILFTFMQFYVYSLMAGYKMKLRHIYKSALLLSLAQFGMNFAVLGVVGIIVYINLYLFAGTSLGGLLFLGLLLFSLVTYTEVFMTDKLIKKALADPSYTEVQEDNSEKDDMFE